MNILLEKKKQNMQKKERDLELLEMHKKAYEMLNMYGYILDLCVVFECTI